MGVGLFIYYMGTYNAIRNYICSDTEFKTL